MALFPAESIVTLRGPYDVARSIRFWSRSTGELCEQWADGVYRRVVMLGGEPVVLAAYSVGTLEAPAVALAVNEQPATHAQIAEFTPIIRALLGDDLDLAAFYVALRNDPLFAPVITRLYGVRAPRSPLWETLCYVIAGQQISVPFAYLLKQRLVERYGERFEAGGRALYRFPAPHVLAGADPADLAAMQYSRNKASFIIQLAQQIVAGTCDLAGAAQLPTSEAVAYLTQFRGIGRWTAEFWLMRGVGRADALPANDAGVRQGIVSVYGERLAEPELRAFGERWGQWGGLASLYLLAWLREEAARNTKPPVAP